MPTIECASCGVTANMQLRLGTQGRVPQPDGYAAVRVFGTYSCDACHGFNVAVGTPFMPPSEGSEPSWLNENQSVLEWFSYTLRPKPYPDVPGHIAAGAAEAHTCFKVGAYRATGAMARAVIEATAKEKGVTVRGIAEKIDGLAAANLMHANIQAAAHEVRHFGNDMAHGDFVDEVDAEEAEDTLILMDLVLREVYQSPAKVNRVTQRRLDKLRAIKERVNAPVGTS